MDGRRFDGLAKGVAGGISRRRLLSAAVGGVAGIGLHGRSRAERFMTYAECEQAGGEVVARYSKCHAYRQSGGVSCGAFQYHWENVCYMSGLIHGTIDAGCGPCLL